MGAVLYYTSGESLWLNKYLDRWAQIDGGLESVEAGLTKKEQNKLKRIVQLVSAAIAKSPPSTRHVTVYKGIEDVPAEWLTVPVGRILPHTEKGLVSASFDKNMAKTFMSPSAEDQSVLLTLSLPKKTRGLYVRSVSQFEDENELILPHGSRFKVTKRSFVLYRRRRCVHYICRLVSQPKHFSRIAPPRQFVTTATIT
jgi:hypothetical protein